MSLGLMFRCGHATCRGEGIAVNVRWRLDKMDKATRGGRMHIHIPDLQMRVLVCSALFSLVFRVFSSRHLTLWVGNVDNMECFFSFCEAREWGKDYSSAYFSSSLPYQIVG